MTPQTNTAPSLKEVATLRTIVIDYNRIGRAKSFRTALLSDERDGLSVGTHVLIVGDDVPDREAVVTDLTEDAREAAFAFCD
jgi:hypothetical protein